MKIVNWLTMYYLYPSSLKNSVKTQLLRCPCYFVLFREIKVIILDELLA